MRSLYQFTTFKVLSPSSGEQDCSCCSFALKTNLSNQPTRATLRPAGGLKPPRTPFKSAYGLPDEWHTLSFTSSYTLAFTSSYTFAFTSSYTFAFTSSYTLSFTSSYTLSPMGVPRSNTHSPWEFLEHEYNSHGSSQIEHALPWEFLEHEYNSPWEFPDRTRTPHGSS